MIDHITSGGQKLRLMEKMLLVAVLLMCAVQANAQTPDDLLAEANRQFDEAHALFVSATPDILASAKTLFSAAADKFSKIENREGESNSLMFAGRCADDLGQFDEALQFYGSALKLYTALALKEPIAVVNNNIGNIYLIKKDNAVAIKHYETALEIVKSGEAPSIALTVYSALVIVYDNVGEKAKVLEMCRSAIDEARRLGDISAEARMINVMGQVLSDIGDRATALAIFETALKLAVDNKITDLETLVLNNIGTLYHYTGDVQKALDHFQKVLAKVDEKPAPDMYSLALNNMGQTYYAMGEISKALEIYNKVLPIVDRMDDAIMQVTVRNNIGLAYYWLRDNEKALSFYNEALKYSRSSGTNFREATLILNIAAVYQRQGKLSEAVKNLVEVVKIAERTTDLPMG